MEGCLLRTCSAKVGGEDWGVIWRGRGNERHKCRGWRQRWGQILGGSVASWVGGLVCRCVVGLVRASCSLCASLATEDAACEERKSLCGVDMCSPKVACRRVSNKEIRTRENSGYIA